MYRGFWYLMAVSACWLITIMSMIRVHTPYALIFFYITFPLMFILAILFARADYYELWDEEIRK